VPGPYRHISTSTEGETLVLTLELEQVKDYVLAEELRYELTHAVKRANASRIVVDLGNMTFMTSLACVAFLGLKSAVREMGGRLVLCHMTEFIRKVFSAKRLLTPSQHTGNVAFEVTDSLADALEKLAAP
jgi:stage II sporulation protein AA (anti-sigma F factor antagonist)